MGLMGTISRRLRLDGGHHAAAILGLMWLLTITVTWIAAGGTR